MNYSAMRDEELATLVDTSGAFAELEYRYLWLVRLKSTQIFGQNVPEREDLIQEGLLGLYDSAKSYRENGGASFKTYAGICIHNRMCNAVRTHQSSKNLPLNNSVPLDAVQVQTASPEAELERREDFMAVLNQIHLSLSAFEKQVLSLYLSGYKRTEIPLQYGIALKSFDNAMQRVRKKLKAHTPL